MKRAGCLAGALIVLMLVGCSETVTTEAIVDENAAADVAAKQHYAFTGPNTFNLAFFNNPIDNPAYTGLLQGPDGTEYVVLFWSTGSGKPYADPFFAGQSHHFAEIARFYTEVVLNDENAVVSGDPVLTMEVKGIVSPNDPARTHFESAGTVTQGEGVFEAWVGRRVSSSGWQDIDPDTGLPLPFSFGDESVFYLH